MLAAKEAGADCIIVSGLGRDRRRLEVARQLGADYTVDVEREDLVARVAEITGGRGVDSTVDTSSGGNRSVTLTSLEVKRKGGTMVVQGAAREIPNFPIDKLTRKYVTVKSARGHCYDSVELALQWIGSGKFPLDALCTHQFGLDGVDAGDSRHRRRGRARCHPRHRRAVVVRRAGRRSVG